MIGPVSPYNLITFTTSLKLMHSYRTSLKQKPSTAPLLVFPTSAWLTVSTC